VADAGAGYTSISVVTETPAAVAVKVTLWALLTFDAAALNPAVVAPAGTVTADGTVTAELLLERETRTGAVAAALR